MLVLSRKTQEKICIGDSIVVTILSVKGNSVRVGIEAPRSVRIVRSELEPLTEHQPIQGNTEATTKSEAIASPSAIPAPAPVDLADDAEEIARLGAPGSAPTTHNRISHLSMPMTQFVARPR